MARYTNRLRARLALQKLGEAKNAWVVNKDMLLKTESGDMDLKKGAIVEMFATKQGHLAIKESGILVVVDDDIAAEVADNVSSAKELGSVKFVKKSVLDAAMDGASIDELIDGLADEDEDSEEVERAEVDVEEKESVEAKFAKLEEAEYVDGADAPVADEVEIADDDTSIDLASVTSDTLNVNELTDYEEFKTAVQGMNGSIIPGDSEIACNEDGKIVGYFSAAEGKGVIYPEKTFDSAEEVTSFEPEAEPLMQDAEFEKDLPEAACEAIEESLKAYEESAQSGADYVTFTESLAKAGLEESVIGKIANTFVSRSLTEGTVVAFDTKHGAVVKALSENVDMNNWIADTKEETRFTKRFIA